MDLLLDIEGPNRLIPQEQRFAALLTFGFFLFFPLFPGMIHMTISDIPVFNSSYLRTNNIS